MAGEAVLQEASEGGSGADVARPAGGRHLWNVADDGGSRRQQLYPGRLVPARLDQDYTGELCTDWHGGGAVLGERCRGEGPLMCWDYMHALTLHCCGICCIPASSSPMSRLSNRDPVTSLISRLLGL